MSSTDTTTETWTYVGQRFDRKNVLRYAYRTPDDGLTLLAKKLASVEIGRDLKVTITNGGNSVIHGGADRAKVLDTKAVDLHIEIWTAQHMAHLQLARDYQIGRKREKNPENPLFVALATLEDALDRVPLSQRSAMVGYIVSRLAK